jgi:hypothetical protein
MARRDRLHRVRNRDILLLQIFDRFPEIFHFSMGFQMVQVCLNNIGAVLHHVLHDLPFTVGPGFPLLHGKGPFRTGLKAGAQTVAKEITDQTHFTVNDLKRPLGAIRHTEPAAVAFVFIYGDDASFHDFLPSYL